MVSRAAGADKAFAEGYEDAQGNWRIPHKLLMVHIHAGWCRVCKGLQPKLLKLVVRHPEVLCCKINKTNHEVIMRDSYSKIKSPMFPSLFENYFMYPLLQIPVYSRAVWCTKSTNYITRPVLSIKYLALKSGPLVRQLMANRSLSLDNNLKDVKKSLLSSPISPRAVQPCRILLQS